ncbi:hypothetical protein N7488_008902 [Penicillium malachiteum]|nr:hypothetical protein N7488_008902 [Penicillium malachiteum]
MEKSSESDIISMDQLVSEQSSNRNRPSSCFLALIPVTARAPTSLFVRFADKSSLAYESTIYLCGLINLDICRPATALSDFEETYKQRTPLLSDDDPFLVPRHIDIAFAFTELEELEKAREHLY